MVNIYAANEAEFKIGSGKIKLQITGNYPWDGNIKINIARAP